MKLSDGLIEVVYAAGKNWYGEQLFGPKTLYGMANQPLELSRKERNSRKRVIGNRGLRKRPSRIRGHTIEVGRLGDFSRQMQKETFHANLLPDIMVP